ncbi:MAG: Yip1 family protein, partial [Chloroflexi bacterium]|nr:Yip1 family protein [Chloroflexota bacterium]
MDHQTESHPDKKGTDINKYIDLKRIKRVLKLDKRIFKEIRDDKNAFIPALTVLYVSSLVPMMFSFLYTLDSYFFHYNFFANFGGYFGSVFGFQSMGMLFFGMIVSLVLTVFFLPLGWFIGAGILHLIAKALGGKSSFKGYMYATAYTRVPAVLTFIPFIGGLIGGLWSLACLVVATRETQE